MEDLLINTLLELFGYPVRLQGSLGANEPYPDHFFTFWNTSSNSDGFYDNVETNIEYKYRVCFYSNDPEAVYTKLREAVKALKAVGFIISGDGYSVASDEPTHDGRAVDVTFLKRV